MKKITLLISFLMLFAILFGACTLSADPGTNSTGESTESTGPTESTGNETGNTEQSDTKQRNYSLPYTLADSTALTAAELAEFQTLFTGITGRGYTNWYNLLLFCGDFEGFRMPKDVDLRRLFNNGFKWESATTDAVTEEEQAFLQQQDHYTGKGVVRLPAEKVNQVLKTYMGITLADVTKEHVEKLMYMPETDCYYLHPAGAAGEGGFRIACGVREPDGTVHLLSVHREGKSMEERRVIQLVPAPEGNPVPYYVQSCKALPDLHQTYGGELFVYDLEKLNYDQWILNKFSRCEPGALYDWNTHTNKVSLVTDEELLLYQYVAGISYVTTAEPNKIYVTSRDDLANVKVLYESDFGPITKVANSGYDAIWNHTIKIIEDNKRLVIMDRTAGTVEIVKEMYYLEDVEFRCYHTEYVNGSSHQRFETWKDASYILFYGQEHQGDPLSQYSYNVATGELTLVAVLP